MIRHLKTLATLILISSIGLAGCAGNEDVQLPPELVGRWTTEAPKYADRYFELRADRMAVFGRGAGQHDAAHR